MDLLRTSVSARESAGEPPTVVVALSGEADVTSSGQLQDLLGTEVAKQPGHLIIDLSGLGFMDSSGLHAILLAHRVLGGQGGVLSLLAPQEAISRLLRQSAIDQLIPVYASIEEAAKRRPAPRHDPS